MPFSVTESSPHSTVRNSTHTVRLCVIFHSHYFSCFFSDVFRVDSFIITCRETIVNPKKGAYLAFGKRLLHNFHVICVYTYDFSWPDVSYSFIIQIRKTCRFAGCAVGSVFLTDYDRRSTKRITSCYYTVFRQYKH